jgi:hypothetical protein
VCAVEEQRERGRERKREGGEKKGAIFAPKLFFSADKIFLLFL